MIDYWVLFVFFAYFALLIGIAITVARRRTLRPRDQRPLGTLSFTPERTL